MNYMRYTKKQSELVHDLSNALMKSGVPLYKLAILNESKIKDSDIKQELSEILGLAEQCLKDSSRLLHSLRQELKSPTPDLDED
jgi:hypothetical protein